MPPVRQNGTRDLHLPGRRNLDRAASPTPMTTGNEHSKGKDATASPSTGTTATGYARNKNRARHHSTSESGVPARAGHCHQPRRRHPAAAAGIPNRWSVLYITRRPTGPPPGRSTARNGIHPHRIPGRPASRSRRHEVIPPTHHNGSLNENIPGRRQKDRRVQLVSLEIDNGTRRDVHRGEVQNPIRSHSLQINRRIAHGHQRSVASIRNYPSRPQWKPRRHDRSQHHYSNHLTAYFHKDKRRWLHGG